MGESPFWQTAFLFASILVLFWQTWRGWRAGLFRSGVNFAAILVSAVLGLLGAEVAAMPFGGLHTLTGFLVGTVVGGGLGVFLFFAIWFFGVVAFKRTEHHAFGPLRLVWGAGGALFGLLIGLAVLLGSIAIVRSLGALAESRVQRKEQNGAASPAARATSGIVALKHSLELGAAGRFLQTADLLPSDFYEMLAQIGEVTNDQGKMLRFLDYPGIRELVENPRVVDLVSDPSAIQAWQKKNIFLLLENDAVAAAVKDPSLARQLRKVDLPGALKFALDPTSSPSPSPKEHR